MTGGFLGMVVLVCRPVSDGISGGRAAERNYRCRPECPSQVCAEMEKQLQLRVLSDMIGFFLIFLLELAFVEMSY